MQWQAVFIFIISNSTYSMQCPAVPVYCHVCYSLVDLNVSIDTSA